MRLLRSREGEGFVDVEHPDGGSFRVPLRWTDRAAPWVVPQVDGYDVRLSPDGLKQMALAVRAALAAVHAVTDKPAGK